MKIIFHEQSLRERGTAVAMYDYAFYSKNLLNATPFIFYPRGSCVDEGVLKKFEKEFEVFSYEEARDIQKFVNENNIDFFYNIKFGTKDGVVLKNTKNLIHSVFNTDKNHVHGDVYAVVSEWMSKKTNYEISYVPHMINLPTIDADMREKLGIPPEAVVVGRYGSYETFNINFAFESMLKALEYNENLWFLFVNTPVVVEHQRCLYLDKIYDLYEKVKYINTCDAMLHARDYGETFGLSVLEFACKNKQIISYDNEELQTTHFLGGRNHFLFLKDRCFKYKNENELTNILVNINKNNPFNTLDLNEEFSPTNVMKIFENVFLK